MINQNDVLIKNTAQIFRVARKVTGLTQVEVANAIGISQSSVSKYESGILQPSALDWFNFCSLVNIDSTKALKDGYIDNCSRIKEFFYKDMGFTVPRRYKQNRQLKVREMLPLVAHYKLQYGDEGWEQLTDKLKMDPDYFHVYDASVSLHFLEDFLAHLPGTGKGFLDQAAKLSGNLEMHGELKGFYQNASFAPNVGLAFVKKESLYEELFDVEQNLKGNKQTFVFIPKKDFEKEASSQFWGMYTHFKVEALRNFIVANSRMKEVPTVFSAPRGKGLEIRLSA